MTYPDGIDALVNVNAGDTLAAGGHAARHNSTNTALAEVRNFLASGSANTVLTAGSVVPTWDLVDPVSIANGSAGYVLTAGSAVPTWAPVAAGGKILQVLSTEKTDTFSTNSTSFTDVTGLSVTITPSAASAKVLVLATVNVGSDAGTNRAAIRLVRASTAIGVGASAGSRTLSSGAVYSGVDEDIENVAFAVLDSPNSASATSYKIQLINTGSSSVYVNRSQTDTDGASIYRTASSITVMEVSA
jgi:hypothetical protein